MTWRTQWTKPGHLGPEWHDFRYREAADHLAEICAAAGYEHVRVDEIGRDAGSEPATGDLSDFEPSGVVLGVEGEK